MISDAATALVNKINVSLFRKVKAEHPCVDSVKMEILNSGWSVSYTLLARPLPNNDKSMVYQEFIDTSDINRLGGEQELAKFLYRKVLHTAAVMQESWDREVSRGRSTPNTTPIPPTIPPVVPPGATAATPVPKPQADPPANDVAKFLNFIESRQ